MKTKCKRLLSLLLVFVLVLGLMPSVYAATDEGTQPMTEPAVAEATTEPVGDTEPTVPETTGATEVTEPSESTEGTEATEAPTEAEEETTETPTEAEEETTEPPEDSDEDWTQPPEDDGMSLEEWDELRFADLSCELPAPIEEYFPFDPSIQYPYGEPVENFYPSEVLGENPFGIAMFASDPYAVAPLADMSAIPENMYDNAILRALEYTGYDVQWLKDNGYLYVAQYVSSNINSTNPDVLSDIGYDDYSPFLNGDETVADSSTVTGRAPDIAKFEANGLVCASFVSYFFNNYLPNIEGINTSHIHEAIKATTMNGGSYSTASVWSWSTGLNNLAAKAGSGVTKYTNAKGVKLDVELTAEDLKELANQFKAEYKAKIGAEFPSDPKEQLMGAIKAVFRSWDNPRANVYRRDNDIPYSWGTAVNVQSMAFGNMGDDCGTGVAFTRDPATGEKKLMGEFLTNAQGEDVVAGVRTPMPIAEMENKFPEAFKQFVEVCQILENHYHDMQDMEFTVEHGQLYMLQTRNGKRTAPAALQIAVDLVAEGHKTEAEAVLMIDPRNLR